MENFPILVVRRDVFQAIADPTRRAILLLLATQSLPAGVIAARFDTARPTISKHLQILTECELLTNHIEGRQVIYHFNPGKMIEFEQFVEQFRLQWDTRFNRLEAAVKNNNKNEKS